jgi:hypothetical protein
MKNKKLKAYCFWYVSGIFLGLVPFAHDYANSVRFQNSWGGEILLPLLPFLLRELWKMFEEI